MTTEIKFIRKYVTPIILGAKTATVRYGWDSENLPNKGEQITLVNSFNNNNFATATVENVEHLTIEEFVNQSWSGHKEYDSVEDMIWALGHFYDESELDAETEIAVIHWNSVEEI